MHTDVHCKSHTADTQVIERPMGLLLFKKYFNFEIRTLSYIIVWSSLSRGDQYGIKMTMTILTINYKKGYLRVGEIALVTP